MRQVFERLVNEKKLLQKTSDRICQLPEPEQHALLSFIYAFRLGINYCYLCMESVKVWNEAGISNSGNNRYKKYIDFYVK